MKWLRVPFSNETKLVEAVQLWEVRWRSNHSRYADDRDDTNLVQSRQEVEAFTSKEEADAFAISLRQAFDLIRSTHRVEVKVIKAKSDAPTMLQAVS